MKKSKIIGMLILVFLLGVLIFQNRGPVETHFLIFSGTIPLIILLVLTTGIGFVLGLLMVMGVNRRKRKRV